MASYPIAVTPNMVPAPFMSTDTAPTQEDSRTIRCPLILDDDCQATVAASEARTVVADKPQTPDVADTEIASKPLDEPVAAGLTAAEQFELDHALSAFNKHLCSGKEHRIGSGCALKDIKRLWEKTGKSFKQNVKPELGIAYTTAIDWIEEAEAANVKLKQTAVRDPYRLAMSIPTMQTSPIRYKPRLLRKKRRLQLSKN
jgi:ribosomal protein L7/L12